MPKLKQFDMDSLVNYISQIVAKESGNILGQNQKSMVQNRLNKRLIDLGNLDPESYYHYLENNYQVESTHLVGMLTTHHTYFFREFCHFEYLLQHLSEIITRVKARGDNKIRVLSAGCSKGHEVYSLAMFLNEHLATHDGISFEVVGVDIDAYSIKYAKNGVYFYSEIKSIPQIYLSGNWQKGTGEISRFAKIKNHIKEKCVFEQMNLLHDNNYLQNQKFDIIFCRNVFIYFNNEDIEIIVNRLKNNLFDNSLFVTGLSESLNAINIQKKRLGPNIYSFAKNIGADSLSPLVGSEVKTNDSNKKRSSIPSPIKILAVDDSPSVLKLLAKIFEADSQFELVGTASNGIEAQDFLKHNQVDAMTLDIHMPEMDGVEYLKKNYHKSHPHVVIVSSASREDTRYAQETLKHGASDFVEKPSLNNLSERAEEIKNKIKMSFLNSHVGPSQIDVGFATNFEIDSPEQKARFFVCSFSDITKLKATLKELRGVQPPIFIFFEGNANYLELIQQDLGSTRKVEIYKEGISFENGKIYLCDLKTNLIDVSEKFISNNISLSVFGIVSSLLEQIIIEREFGQILLEDNEQINNNMKEIVSDIFPWTSFAHIATEFLTKLK